MLTVLLTRHGHTDRSEPDRYTGQTIEAHLTETGLAGARALGQRLAGVAIARVLSSPLERALDTARLIRPDQVVETDERLMEADYGDWEGLTTEDIEARWPAERTRWEADPASVPYPAGESGKDVARRARSFLDDLIAWEGALSDPESDHRVLAVGHATLNRVLLTVALDVPLRDFRRRFRQDWVNLTVLRFDRESDEGAMLLLGNDLAHVRGIRGATWE
jgi:alpha-ribazole phosphatase/probable phosphoglycerate mutase